MMAQMTYGYQMPRGVAGGIYDNAYHEAVSRNNGEAEDGILKFGMGAVVGDVPGNNVVKPTADSTIEVFEGVVMHGHNQEMDMAGEVKLRAGQTLSVMRWGNIWARIADNITVAYGDKAYLIIAGDDAGLFTNEAGTGNLAISGKFIGEKGTGNIAPITLYKV